MHASVACDGTPHGLHFAPGLSPQRPPDDHEMPLAKFMRRGPGRYQPTEPFVRIPVVHRKAVAPATAAVAVDGEFAGRRSREVDIYAGGDHCRWAWKADGGHRA